MESSISLKHHVIQNRIRQVGINENYWYPVAWSHQLPVGQILAITIWGHSIAVYRDVQGQVHALENACPHKGVELHLGEVQGDCLVCPYHGWQFNPQGQCVAIPYFPAEQKLPRAQARRYPAADQYGMIWVFPGNSQQASSQAIPAIPEYDDPNCLAIPITGIFAAHFSICNENTMDVFHGFLHKNLQGWFNPVLLDLQEGDDYVNARYQVSYKGFLSQFLGLGSDNAGVSTRIVSIHYQYPHYHSTLEGVSSLYLMRLPVSPTQTRSFSWLFLPKIRLPKWLLRPLKPTVVPLIRRLLFMPFLEQDMAMMASEQRTYSRSPNRQYVEVNPAIIALQRVIMKQYELYQQQMRWPKAGRRPSHPSGLPLPN
ncbi:Rieske domain/chlorophyllide a oxygenase domain protein [Halomicronema hongdechloris C2206]|uniref:Rieske domain/chlorophyllide a oxygenase domain protein n=1 Tax=Halomicronema hongdechloris C2206 TaxID=1641165 RepID=A0A1Z3HGE9_9CYAN|nr:aromatic ring-hydroxylating dioxygenase subunit alpha [Halomicronema hongdechloris]ASC69373.1 Rieske domain/chlorophyllide a oxygenase domain protein [Halomicronema hongdechloris C2206]